MVLFIIYVSELLIFSSDKFHGVVVNKCLSGWLKCISGVRQGSILGPLLFNIYPLTIQLFVFIILSFYMLMTLRFMY